MNEFIKEKTGGFLSENWKSIGIILIVLILVGWYLFSGGNNDGRVEQVGQYIHTTGEQQQRAGEAIRASQQLTSEIKRTNTEIGRTNTEARSQIESSQRLNKSSSELITEGRNIVESVIKRNQEGTDSKKD